jgi:hypothetical protein
VERRVLPAARREVREVRRAVLGVQDEPVPDRGGRRGAVIFFFEPKRDKKKTLLDKKYLSFRFCHCVTSNDFFRHTSFVFGFLFTDGVQVRVLSRKKKRRRGKLKKKKKEQR